MQTYKKKTMMNVFAGKQNKKGIQKRESEYEIKSIELKYFKRKRVNKL